VGPVMAQVLPALAYKGVAALALMRMCEVRRAQHACQAVLRLVVSLLHQLVGSGLCAAASVLSSCASTAGPWPSVLSTSGP
jgi:hypothetical protein